MPPPEIETTLSIVKPDAVAAGRIGTLVARLEAAGLRVAAQKMIRMDAETAGGFYAEHRQQPFFASLVEFMTSGPVVVQVLAGQDAIAVNRRVMGATDPARADKGTIRADFGTSIGHNAIHGSDSPESARREIDFFFPADEIFAD